MKKFNFKRTISIILLLVVVTTALSTTVSARYQYITLLSAGLDINSNGLAVSEGCVTPSDSNTSTTLTVELQKYSSGWSKDDSWSNSGDGRSAISKSGSKYVAKGKYRVVVTAQVYDSKGKLLETQSITSNEVTY